MILQHPTLGAVEIDWSYEPRTNRQVCAIDSVWSADGVVTWFMPNGDYEWFEQQVYDTAAFWEHDDYDADDR